MIGYLKNNFNKNKKGISPLIATILLIVVAVAIVAIVLNWSRDFTTTHTDDISDIISPSEFSSGFVNFRLIRDTTFHLENLYKESITITGYMIISDKGDESHDLLNIYIDLDPSIEILPNQTAQINLACIPERNFQVNFRLSDNTYFTKNVTSTSPNINYCDSEYTPSEPLFICDNSTAGGFFFSGEGTESEPYGICDCQMLQDIDNYLEDTYYKLLTNIDCSEFQDFSPIGNWSSSFDNVDFNGNNYTISNLDIVGTEEWEPIGIFGFVENSNIYNVSLENISISSSFGSQWDEPDAMGVLLGFATNTTLSNINIKDSFVNIGNNTYDFIGGLGGNISSSQLSNIYIENVSVEGNEYIGGLVGFLNSGSTLENISVLNLVEESIYGNSSVGGIVGMSFGIITNSSFEGKLKSNEKVGGIVGENFGDLDSISVSADITGTSIVGGILGKSYETEITNSFFEGSVTGIENVGGVLGASPSNIILDNISFLGNVQGNNYVGGFAGYLYGSITNSTFEGIVSGVDYVGGFISSDDSGQSSVINSSSFGQIIGVNYVGGIYGNVGSSTIQRSNFQGYISGFNYVGGISGIIQNGWGNEVSENFVYASISGNNYVGGLVGEIKGITTDSYFIGDISGNNNVGGLFGSACCGLSVERNYYGGGSITAVNDAEDGSYGSVLGEWTSGDTSTFHNIYYNDMHLDINSIGFDDTGGSSEQFLNVGRIEGKSISELKNSNTFENWNFIDLWEVDEGNSFPYFVNNMQDPLPSEDLYLNLKLFAINLVSPTPNSEYLLGDNINFLVEYEFNNGDVSCSWNSSIDGVFGEGCNIDVDNLTNGMHIITLTTKDDVFKIEEEFILYVGFFAFIDSPEKTYQLYLSDVNFNGFAKNSQGNVLCSWSSSIDGNLGNDCDLIVNDLSLGDHTITLTIQDDFNLENIEKIIKIRDDELYLYSWGDNEYGKLGDGTVFDKNHPSKIEGIFTWEKVSAGRYHSLGIKNEGELWAWGWNYFGGTGLGTILGQATSPTQVGNYSDWEMISAGETHSLGIRNGGELWAWGDNWNGKVGDGTETNRLEPVRIGEDSDWEMISAGGSHSLAIKNGGELWAWGRNNNGQLGDGNSGHFAKELEPKRIGNDSDWEYISAGPDFSLAVKNGELWVWGHNRYGQLGDGTDGWGNQTPTPTRIGNDSDWEMVSAGQYHSLGMKNGGELWAWGINWSGRLGDGTVTARLVPTIIDSYSDWELVSAGSSHSVGLRNNGELWVWGSNWSGALGDGTTEDRLEPVRIGTDSDWIYISPGWGYSLGLKEN